MSNDNRENRNPFASGAGERPPVSGDERQQPDREMPEDDHGNRRDSYGNQYRAEDADQYTDDYDDDELEYEFDDDEDDDLEEILPRDMRAQRPPSPAGTSSEGQRLTPPVGSLLDPAELDGHSQDYDDLQNQDDDPDWDQDDLDDGPAGRAYDSEGPSFADSWPLGLIAVAALALILLAAGGYGVMQQRASLNEEVRDLQAQLAVAVSPDTVAAERAAQRELTQRNADLEATLEGLRLENRQLSDTVAGLEEQLQAQRNADGMAAATPATSAGPATSATPPEPAATEVTTPATAAPAATGDIRWFVNFGSYSQQEAAQAWSRRLQPASGEVVVNSAETGGTTVYRVRVVNLNSRDAAEKVARSLEQQYRLPKLWVGRQ